MRLLLKAFIIATLLATSYPNYFTNNLVASASSEILQRGTNSEGKVTTPLANPNDSYGLLGDLVSTLITIIIIAAAVTAFVFFIVGAIQWGTAAGGEGAAKARLTMIYAAVGLIAVALVYVVMILFNNVLPFAPGYDIPSDCTEGGPC